MAEKGARTHPVEPRRLNQSLLLLQNKFPPLALARYQIILLLWLVAIHHVSEEIFVKQAFRWMRHSACRMEVLSSERE